MSIHHCISENEAEFRWNSDNMIKVIYIFQMKNE